MKLIGKQIVVELPEKSKHKWNPSGIESDRMYAREKGWDSALSEVAKMNQAWEVDEEEIVKIIAKNVCKPEYGEKDPHKFIAHALASNPSAWMKRKDVDGSK